MSFERLVELFWELCWRAPRVQIALSSNVPGGIASSGVESWEGIPRIVPHLHPGSEALCAGETLADRLCQTWTRAGVELEEGCGRGQVRPW